MTFGEIVIGVLDLIGLFLMVGIYQYKREQKRKHKTHTN